MTLVNATESTVYNGTLTANAIDYVTLTNPNETVTIINRDGTAEISFTVDGVTNPTVGGQNDFICPAAIGGVTVRFPQWGRNQVFNATNQPASTTGAVMVQLISSGTPKYSVQILPD